MTRRLLQALCFSLLNQRSYASEIVFKPAFMPKISGFNMGLTVVAVLIMALFWLRSHKAHPKIPSMCQLLEKKHLSNKTIVYMLSIENQRFLLADNQQTMVLHAIDAEKTHVAI